MVSKIFKGKKNTDTDTQAHIYLEPVLKTMDSLSEINKQTAA